MILMGLDDKPITDRKQQMLYIFNGYKYTRPTQSNLFKSIQRSYRADMLDNATNIDAQMRAIKTSLTTLYTRYGYSADLNVTITFDENTSTFSVDVSGTRDGVFEKLSDALILEK